MFWSLFNRRNLIILAVVLLVISLGTVYARLAFVKKDNELLQSNVANLKEDIKVKEKAITDLNKEVEMLLKEKEVLEETLKSNDEKIKAAEKVFSDIKNEFNISVEEILEDPDNYVITEDLHFSFNQDTQSCEPIVIEKEVTKPVKHLNTQGQRKVSEKTLDAMWQSYCHAYGCNQ